MICEIGNVNTVEHIKFHTDFSCFFGFNIELGVFNSMLPVEFLEYTASKESSFCFQGITDHALCLLCMH